MLLLQDPEVAQAFQDISVNPANFVRYQSNPKIMGLITKLSSKFSGSGMNFPEFPGTAEAGAEASPGCMGFTGGLGGTRTLNTTPPPTKPADNDNLD
ncbi:hypothetical protein NQ317_002679 [Molorchus minor]|uniref:STI1 domain-containing protein n=1 Tax=Molorchus minor TaxID=1323400 RepID=A0ABQ9JZ33_9CUCU|nr:hypothetical protein NQ317_002679 [Molorchus minor]